MLDEIEKWMQTISQYNHMIPHYNLTQFKYALNLSEHNIQVLLNRFVLKKSAKLFSICMDLQRYMFMKRSIMDGLENSNNIELAKNFNRFYNLDLNKIESFDITHTTLENRTKTLANFDVSCFMDFLELVTNLKISKEEKLIFNDINQKNKNQKRNHQSYILKSFKRLENKIYMNCFQSHQSDFYFDHKNYLISIQNAISKNQDPNWEQIEPLLKTFLQAKQIWEKDKKTWIEKQEKDQKEILFQKMQWIIKQDCKDLQTIKNILQNDSDLETSRLNWQDVKTKTEDLLQRLKKDFSEIKKTQGRYLTIIGIAKMILNNLDKMQEDVSVYFENQEKNIKSLQGFGAYNFLTKILNNFNCDAERKPLLYFKIIDSLKEDFTGGIEGIDARMQMTSIQEIEKKIGDFIQKTEQELYDLIEGWEKPAQENPLRFLITSFVQ